MHENCTGLVTLNAFYNENKSFDNGSYFALKFKALILQYLGPERRLRTHNAAVGVIFDAQLNDYKSFRFFENFPLSRN